jgi:hypothetical protein
MSSFLLLLSVLALVLVSCAPQTGDFTDVDKSQDGAHDFEALSLGLVEFLEQE